MDSVLDAKFVGSDSKRIVVATNNSELHLFDLVTRDTSFLVGHTDVVLTVDVSRNGKFIISGSKDHSACIWEVDSKRYITLI